MFVAWSDTGLHRSRKAVLCSHWEAGCSQAEGPQRKGLCVRSQLDLVTTQFDRDGNEMPGQCIVRGHFVRKFEKQNSHIEKLILLILGGNDKFL